MAPIDSSAAFPLSPAQSALWFAQHLAPEVPLTVAQYVDLKGDLDIALLAKAANTVGVEMQVGQLRLLTVDGEPHQIVDPDIELKTTVVDLRDEADPQEAALTWMHKHSSSPIDIERDPLAANFVLHLGEQDYIWYTRVHHIVIDGFGAMTVLNRMAELYTAAVENNIPTASMAHSLTAVYATQTAYQNSARCESDKHYWATQLDGLPEAPSLAGRLLPASAGRWNESGILDDTTSRLLAGAVNRYETHTSTLITAALAAYISAITDSTDVVLSLPVTARTNAILRRSAGMVSNVLPLHVRVTASTNVGDLIENVSNQLAGALRHQRYRHEDIRRENGDGNQARGFFGPMINIMLFHSEIQLGTLTGALHLLSTGPVEDLSVNIYNSVGGSRTHVDFEANPDTYSEDDVRNHHQRFLSFFERFLAAGTRAKVSNLELMHPSERERILETWNATDAQVPATTLADMFAEQAVRTPDSTALVFGAESMTYAELDRRSNKMARLLIDAGVGPEAIVGLAIRRSFDLLVGMYATVKAGGAYLPIDPDHPAERTEYVLEQAQPVVTLTVSRDRVDLPSGTRTLDVDTVDLSAFDGSRVTDSDRLADLGSDNTAYVIYTSGSTGKPKGVAVTHAGIVNRLCWMQHEYRLDDSDAVVQKTPATFDVSVWEFFWPLQVGARLVIAAPDGHRDPAYLAGLIAEHGVTTAHFVPSMLAVFVDDPTASRCTSLRRVFCSGEALATETVDKFATLLPARIHNLYGPTEASVDVSYWECSAHARVVPIGAPVWNTQLYVLDAKLELVPTGATGELYIAGTQLARGYLSRGDLTAGRFVANPLGTNGSRMYRTGDLARWRPDGNLEYLGRTDFQVKVRGLRIELGEIESALLAATSVARAVCVARPAAHGGDELVGYVVATEKGAIEVGDLRESLTRTLPSYMVPASFVVLDELPLSSNGKVDRKALPAPVAPAADGPVRGARNDADATLLRIVSDVLGKTNIGIDDSFFDLGGDSLVASRVIARINAELGAELGIRDLFEAPTVAGLARRITGTDVAIAATQLAPMPRPERVPLSLAQQRLWFLNRFDKTSPVYNMPFAVRLTGELDPSSLDLALTDVIARHESLRTTFPDSADGPHQLIHNADALTMVGDPIDVDSDQIDARLIEFASRGFDLIVDRPIRSRLFRTAADEHVLAIVLHHIAGDGWSFAPLARDIMTAFAARSTGTAPVWSPLPVQYADYALWQRAELGSEDDSTSRLRKQIDHWTQTLAGLPDQLDLPLDRKRPLRPSYAGGTHSFVIDADTHRRLDEIGRAGGASMFMVLHAALSVLLARLSGTTDIAIGSPIAGRGERALDDLVGMFVNTLVLRTEVDPGAGFDALLDVIKDADLTAFANADVPFERLVDALQPERSTSRHPLFQVMLSYERSADIDVNFAGLAASASPIMGDIAKFDLQLGITEPATPGADLTAQFVYATDLFDPSTIASFANRLTLLLQGIVDDPSAPVGDLPILDGWEALRLCPLATVPAEPATTLAEILTEAAQRNPETVALRCDGKEMSYRELDGQSNKLARVLISHGVGPENVVAIALPRSIASVVSIWAVAKAGAAYLPIDPSYPADRIAHMVSDSGMVLGITTGAHSSALPESAWLLLDSDAVANQHYDADAGPIADSELAQARNTAQPAYLIYTSGSTGVPKAVAVTHAGIASFACEEVARFQVSRYSRTLHFSSPSFDASVLELLMGFTAGATVVIAPTDIYGGAELARLLADEHVTHAFVTPAALATMDSATLPELTTVIVGGDACSDDLVATWSTGRAMFNAYGPTEATVAATITSPMSAGAPVTIGEPIRGARLSVLDRRLNPVPLGVPGELYLAGPGLARGYLGRQGLSAGRFVADPRGTGSRMYRTGDLVVISGNRTLRFLGRADDQVKLRGYRIELREIDSALMADPAVSFALTVIHRDDAGRSRLASYITTTDSTADVADILAGVRNTLPEYMIPAAVTVLDQVPMTTAGKIDRRALPQPQFAVPTASREARTDAERRVAAVFTSVLGCDSVGVDDSFFDLGGNSLLATRLASGIGEAFGTEVEVRTIFDSPTISALLERLDGSSASGRAPLARVTPRPTTVPLSLAQQRLWFLNQFDATSSAYNIAFAIHFVGEVNVSALQYAFADVIERHESLRTIFPSSDEGPRQLVVDADKSVPDLSITDVDAARATEILESAARTGFDLTAETPLRVTLVHNTEHNTVSAAVVVHHIAADGWSMAPLTADLMTAYRARLIGTDPEWAPLPVQYADYTLWQRKALGDDSDSDSVAGAQLEYWTTALADIPDELPLPYDRVRPAAPTFAGSTVPVTVPAELQKSLSALARRNDVSLFMVVHTALAVLLRHATGARDITIGSPIAGRRDTKLDSLIGMFVNTLVLRTEVDPHESFDTMLGAGKDTVLAAMANAEIPFERLVEAINPDRGSARHPLFQVALSFDDVAIPNLEMPGVTMTAEALDLGLSKFDLELRVAGGSATERTFEFVYSSELFDESTIRTLSQRLITVLTAVAASPSAPVGQIDVLTRSEQESLVPAWGAVPSDPYTLAEYFDATVAAHPERTAIRSGREHLTYRQLGERANRLARALIQRGVRADDIVALGLSRSIDSVVGALAVTKTGAAYLPVDPNYPAERIAHMLSDSAAVLGMTTADDRARMPGGIEWMNVDGVELALAGEPVLDWERTRTTRIDDVAYVIYTSGSTGIPKGVAVTHRGLSNFADEERERFAIDTNSRTLHFASPSFDASVLELLLAISAGATMVIAPTDVYGGDELAELLEEQRVTHAFITPAALASIDSDRWPLPELRVLAVGGEAYGSDLIARWSTNRSMFNVYGPTETTIVATVSDPMTTGGAISIGRPLRGVRAVVLDELLRSVPTGVPGDLYLAGNGLARGYLGRAGLTADRFVADPFGVTGDRMYRTGDVVRWDRDGNLAFVGRSDDQVKVRGFRIELGEIDAAVVSHEGVRFAHTEVRNDDSGTQRIVTFVVLTEDPTAVLAIREHAATRLPVHMVPSAFVVLDEIPLSPTGKLDRRGLPEPVFAAIDAGSSREPSTRNEQLVASIVADVVGATAVGADDNFFDIGGNSLLATQLVSRIATATGHRVAVRDVFQTPTVAALAARLGAEGDRGDQLALVSMERPDRIPLSLAQQRLWFLNRFDTSSGAYNIPLALRLGGAVDAEAFELAIRDVQQRHETLRTVFPDSHDGPHQEVRTIDEVGITLHREHVDVDAMDVTGHEFFAEGFDLTSMVPLRAALFSNTADQHVLVLVIHHIVMDGWSLAPLAADLMQAYAARTAGNGPEWAELDVQYADYTLWQRAVLGDEADPSSLAATQLEFWRTTLVGLPEHLDLPSDRPRPPTPSYRGGSARTQVTADVHRGLTEIARAHDASLFMVLHTALAVLLHRLANTDDVAIGTAIAGRGEQALDKLVGMFVGTLVLRTDVQPALSFTELLANVRGNDLDAFENADIPFERLVEVLNPTRSTSHHPLFQVMLSVQNQVPTAVELPGLQVEAAEIDSAVAKFDMQFTLTESYTDDRSADGIGVMIDYATDLFDHETAEQVARRFVNLLNAVVSHPATPVGDLEILAPAEISALAPVHGMDTGSAVPLPEVFAAAVEANPHGVALSSNGIELTYTELDDRSTQLARVLADLGVGPETYVALGIPRSIESVLAVVAVTKTGAAFVPVDPNYPSDRIAHMLTDSRAAIGLTTAADRDRLPSTLDWLTLDDAEFSSYVAQMPAEPITDADRTTPLLLEHPAYLVYTSGSTGTPKGVIVSHGGISNFASETQKRFDVRHESRVLHFATPSFDAAMLDLLFALGGGATLVIAPVGIYGGRDLSELLAAERITHSFITTAALSTVDPELVTDLTHVLVGGEACPPELVSRWATGRNLYNVYGPTETTIVTTMGAPMAPGTPITIGGPIRGVSAMVLDGRLHPVPVGVTGELYLAGPELARGYQHRPGLTSERFVANPHGKPGERMYRTGDLVRWSSRTAAREIEYVGRTDHQVKIRGFRIELGEIDVALSQHAAVEFSTTIGHELPSGATALVSYVKLAQGHAPAVADLTEHLAGLVPNYMVPQSITLLDTLPLTPVGKLDRKALPAPVFTTHEHREPTTDAEKAICQAFAEVLALDTVSAEDSFFELGGNSLLATRVVAILRDEHDLDVPMQALFTDPTPAGMAHRIGITGGSAAAAIEASLETVLPVRPQGTLAPLFCVHPAIGLSWCYTGLLSHIESDRPVYGLQSPMLSGEDEPFDSIEEVAERYISEIKSIRPEGPYHLLGWSLGGLIAHEMAVQLKRNGDDVALLTMLDSFVLSDEHVEDAQPSVAELLEEFGPAVEKPAEDVTLEDAAEMIRKQPGPFEALTASHLERMYAGYANGTDLAYKFEPGTFDGEVLFFTAAADVTNLADPTRNASAWRPFVRGGIHDYAVDCEHSAMTTPESLAEIGPVLHRYLEISR
ncbi:non-ribosomal peptide synthetase [Antrihabitans cavernicola]|uniref:Amino acid adenylation domain-containing protein n=1 Tax=Antrihabitans cavernicola TaxID=2495913 RepID=A0A5A7S9R3_9NOCA|nr:non-ribosomal peptide synthetase [Spelaeibacter cavernicola]KAA0021323.1 amino acid adenylation domain-containing protein [Spelaeibacter cavernicola]